MCLHKYFGLIQALNKLKLLNKKFAVKNRYLNVGPSKPVLNMWVDMQINKLQSNQINKNTKYCDIQ